MNVASQEFVIILLLLTLTLENLQNVDMKQLTSCKF